MAIMVNNNNLWNGIATTSRSSSSRTPRLIPRLSPRSTSQDNILPSPPSIIKRPYSFTCDGLEEPLPYQPSLDAMEQADTVQTVFRLKPRPQHQDQDYEIDDENVPRTMPTSYDVPSSRRRGYGIVPARDPSKKLVRPMVLPTKAPWGMSQNATTTSSSSFGPHSRRMNVKQVTASFLNHSNRNFVLVSTTQ